MPKLISISETVHTVDAVFNALFGKKPEYIRSPKRNFFDDGTIALFLDSSILDIRYIIRFDNGNWMIEQSQGWMFFSHSLHDALIKGMTENLKLERDIWEIEQAYKL